MKPKLSFVIPCYRSALTLPGVLQEIRETMQTLDGYSYEVVMVNDCSPDDLWVHMQDMARQDPHLTAVNLARNFGQDSALMAGYRFATGDIIISMDDDGQNPAGEAVKLLQKLEEGYDVVFASYEQFMESPFRRFGSRVNSMMAEHLVGKPRHITIQSFFAARRFVIQEMLKYDQAYPYVFGLIFRTTQNIANARVVHRSREVGTSGYTLPKLLGAWMNGFTAFSIKPLRVATLIGILSSAAGFLMAIYFFIEKFIDPTVPMGYSSLITSIVFFSGMIMVLLGLIGEYIGRIYICINHAPQFVVKDVVRAEKPGAEDGKE